MVVWKYDPRLQAKPLVIVVPPSATMEESNMAYTKKLEKERDAAVEKGAFVKLYMEHVKIRDKEEDIKKASFIDGEIRRQQERRRQGIWKRGD